MFIIIQLLISLISLFLATQLNNPMLSKTYTDGSMYPPGTRIFVYLRCSRNVQDLNGQEAAVLAYAAQYGWIIVKIYRDEAITGSGTVERPGFEQMRKDALQTPLRASLLLIWDYSRFSRNVDKAILHLAELRAHGWIIHSMTDQVPTGDIGRIIETFIHIGNAQYLERIRTNTQRGMRELATMGYLPSGNPAVGYVAVKEVMGTGHNRINGDVRTGRRCVIDEEMKDVVIKAFELKSQGVSHKNIVATTGIRKRVETPGAGWGRRSPDINLERMFKNQVYIGKLHYGGYVYDNVYPRLISDDLWQAVQQVLEQNRLKLSARLAGVHPRRKASSFFLSGYVTCGHCGTLLVGSKGGNIDHTYSYYRCKGCVPNWTCVADDLEEAVMGTLQETILQPDLVSDLVTRTNEMLSQALGDTVGQYESAKKALNILLHNQTKLERILLALEGDASEALLMQYRECRHLIQAQEFAVAELDRARSRERVRYSGAEIERDLVDKRALVSLARSNGEDQAFLMRQILNYMVSRITVHRGGECEIVLHVPLDWFSTSS